ncbi:MAG: hypothetical protein ACFB0F_14490 [Neomegalonema sp.]
MTRRSAQLAEFTDHSRGSAWVGASLPALAVGLALSFAATPQSAQAQSNADACASAAMPAGEFTEIERAAWQEICTSSIGFVDKSIYDPTSGDGAGAGCDANAEEAWSPNRQLSQRFFDAILFEEPYKSARKSDVIDISCAWMPQFLNLNYRRIEPAVFVNNSRFDSGLSLSYTRSDRTLSFQGNRILGDLNAERLRITDNFFIRGGTTVTGVTLLRGATIGGNLEAGGSVYGESGNTGAVVFNADSMVVEGSAFMSQAAQFNGEVRLVGAQIDRGLEIGSSTFYGRLNGDSLNIGSTLFMIESTFFGEVLFRASHIRGGIEAGGSVFEGDLFIDRCVIGSSVFTRNAVFRGQANFVSTTIGESIEFGGADFQGTVNLESVEVARSVFFNQEVTFGSWVNLRYSDIGSNIVANGATFNDRLYGEGMRVRRSVQLRDGATLRNGLVFDGAQIDGSILLGGAVVEDTVQLRNIELADNLDLSTSLSDPNKGASLARGLEMPGSKIGGSVLLFYADIDGRVNMTNSKIDGELALSGANGDPNWGPNSRMVLRNTEVGSLKARPQAWRRPKGSEDAEAPEPPADGEAIEGVAAVNRFDQGEPLSTDLSGFSYERESGLDQGEIASMMTASGSALVAWLESQQGPNGAPHDASYNPQPYEQLANALARDGRLEKAREIRYAKFEHYRRAATTPELRKTGMLVLKYLAGYGIYPYLALGWFGGLVVLGWFVAMASPGLKGHTGTEKFWYSFDNALPLVEMNEHNSKVIHERDWVTTFFHTQRIFGLVLATALIGAVSLL